MGLVALQQMFQSINMCDLDKSQTMTLTSGTYMFLCTDLVNYVYPLSVHRLQLFL